MGGDIDGVTADALSLAGVGQHLDAVVGVALQVVQDHLQSRRRHKVRVTLVCNVNSPHVILVNNPHVTLVNNPHVTLVNNTHVTLVKEKGVCHN